MDIDLGNNQLKNNQILKNSVHKDSLEIFYLQNTVITDIRFLQVEHLDFQKWWQYVNLSANVILFNSHNTIHFQIIDSFFEGQYCVAIISQSSLSFIWMICNASISSNCLAAWIKVGHFTLEESKLAFVLLYLTEIKILLTGENKSKIVWAKLTYYNI